MQVLTWMSPWHAISLGGVEQRRHRRAAPLHECISSSAFCSLCEQYVNIVVISLTDTWCVWITVWMTMLLITRSSSHITGWIPAMTGVVITRSKDTWNFGISLVKLWELLPELKFSDKTMASSQKDGFLYVSCHIRVLRTMLDKQPHPVHQLLFSLLMNTINPYI